MRAVTRIPLLIRVALTAGAAVSTLAVAALASPAAASPAVPARAAVGQPAPQTVLVNQPAARVCVGASFTVGVWYQKFSHGSRAYRVAVYDPRGKRVLYRHGYAPAAHWAFWKVRARMPGKYRTVYWGHWARSGGWSRYRAATRARRC